ncbi:armadillo repeat-containing protein 10 isoform X2 [Hydra vulgaris]|uniref:Armadillo repeat-containing protein 10 isoform X2 n=1 Tax=Hydra vulgaris TaxID=6087 RepID=A0ABM4DJD2_HYDVU
MKSVYVIGSLAFTCAAYGFLTYYISKKKVKVAEKDELLELLQTLDDSEVKKEPLLNVLNKLIELSVFTIIKVRIHDLSYLHIVAKLLNHCDEEVQLAAALLINNLSNNERNQSILKEYIPTLVHILKTTKMNNKTVTLHIAVLNSLTNLTTLEENHEFIVVHINTFCEILQKCKILQIKIQILRVLVNCSSNTKISENMLEVDVQMLGSVERFVHPEEDERCLLRAVHCCANVLSSLHRRWQYGKRLSIASTEFVSQRLRQNLLKLTLHTNEDIRLQAARSLRSLREPICIESNASIDDIDLIEVLKI